MSDGPFNSVLLTTFYCGKKRYRLYFHRNQIVWDNEKPPYAQNTVPIQDVLSVQYNYTESTLQEESTYDPHIFTIHYAQLKEGSIWQYNSLTLRHSDPLQVSSWVKTLQNHLQTFSFRPKRLLLFVNPYGGKRKALKIFEKYGKPLFKIAGVDVSVIVSQRQNQIRDIVIHHNLDMFDSIACVGGDGTVSELVNGLVLRECKKCDIDPDDSNQTLPKPSFPIGIIPEKRKLYFEKDIGDFVENVVFSGGSTDTIAYCLYGTTDVTTAVLHIIFGDSVGLDLVSVHDESRLLRLYASVLSYGYLGDIAYNSERLRWMGPLRYEYCGFKKIVCNQGYKGEITFLTDSDEEVKLKCYQKCENCLAQKSELGDSNKKELNWTTIQGNFFMVSGANISCACERSPSGIAPYCHLGDGYLHLVIIRHTSVLNNLRILWRFSKSNYTTNNLSFVEIHRVKEFNFRAIDIQSRWNCDGEIQHQTDIRAKYKVHCQLLKVFSRGSSTPVETEKSGCGVCRC